MIYFLT